MKPKLIAVTGANGFIGQSLLTHLARCNVPAVGLVRASRSLASRELQKRELPDWSERALTSALAGADAVVHCAYFPPPPGATHAEYRAYHALQTRALVLAARANGVRRVVFLSTLRVYGDEPNGIVDETTPVDPTSPYSATKLDAEQMLLDAQQSGGPSTIALRLCAVYGPGEKGNVRRMIGAIARRRFAIPGDGSTRKSAIHIATLVEAIWRAVESDVSGVFVMADREAPSMRELANIVASALGRSPPPSVPIPLALAMAAVVERVAKLRGRQSGVSPLLIRKSLRSTIGSPHRFEAAVGFDCHMDLRVGVEQEIRWMRASGLL